MRLRTPCLLLLAALGAVYLSSYSTGLAGRGNDGTSSGLGTRECGSCHNGGAFGTSTTVELLDGDGAPVSVYRPGETYTLRVSIATTAAPGGYGLQVLAVDGEARQAGAFGRAPANTKVSALGGRSYFEHRRRLPAAAGAQEIAWTAPEAGAGEVTVYAVGNAVNGNGGTSGDEVDEAVVTFGEDVSLSAGAPAWPEDVRAFGLPGGRIRVSADGRSSGVYDVTVAALDGRAVASRRVLAKAPQTITDVAPGIYVVRVSFAGAAPASRMVAVVQ